MIAEMCVLVGEKKRGCFSHKAPILASKQVGKAKLKQSLNLSLPLCSSGEKEMAAELEEMYGHIDAVELYPGLMVEKPRPEAIFGETMVEMGAPFSLKGLMGNPICSPEYWKPSTFGGKVGFDIVNTATLQKLICNNVQGPCPVASFHVPDVEETGSMIINSSTSPSRSSDINPTVILKERTSEL